MTMPHQVMHLLLNLKLLPITFDLLPVLNLINIVSLVGMGGLE